MEYNDPKPIGESYMDLNILLEDLTTAVSKSIAVIALAISRLKLNIICSLSLESSQKSGSYMKC